MPEAKTIERARADKREGKAPSTQAGEFVREEMDHIRAGKHGARSAKQAIAIGLSKARRAGVKLAAPRAGSQATSTRKRAASDLRTGAHPKKPSAARSRASEEALKREPRVAASHRALARQTHEAATKRGASARQAAGRKAAATRKRAAR